MYILLIFNLHQGHFAPPFHCPSHQVTIHLVLQELLHRGLSVFLLHDHQCRILTHGLAHQYTTLYIPADHLMRPPLMSHFMRGHVERDIDRILIILHLRDEANGFREGNCIRKRLGETGISGELDDPHLPMLIGTEMFRVIIQRFLDRGDHPVDVVFMTFLVPDLNGNIVPPVATQAVLRTQEGEEMQDRTVHFVLEIMSVALFPVLYQIARGNGTLARCGTYCGLESDPVGIPGDIIAHHRRTVIDPGHSGLRLQPVFLARRILAQLRLRIITDRREQAAVDERSVIDHRRVHPGEISVGNKFHFEIKPDAVARQDRLLQTIQADAMIRIVKGNRGRRVEFHDRVVVWTFFPAPIIDVHRVDRSRGAVQQGVLTGDIQGLVFRFDVHRQ